MVLLLFGSDQNRLGVGVGVVRHMMGRLLGQRIGSGIFGVWLTVNWIGGWAGELDEPLLGNYPKRIDGYGDPGECEGEGGAGEGETGGLGLGSFWED